MPVATHLLQQFPSIPELRKTGNRNWTFIVRIYTFRVTRHLLCHEPCWNAFTQVGEICSTAALSRATRIARSSVMFKMISAHSYTPIWAWRDENRPRSGTTFVFFTSFGATEKFLFGLRLWGSSRAHFACYYQLRSVKSLSFTCQNCKGRSSASFTFDVDKRRSLQSQPDCRSPAVFLCGGKDVYLSFCFILLCCVQLALHHV